MNNLPVKSSMYNQSHVFDHQMSLMCPVRNVMTSFTKQLRLVASSSSLAFSCFIRLNMKIDWSLWKSHIFIITEVTEFLACVQLRLFTEDCLPDLESKHFKMIHVRLSTVAESKAGILNLYCTAHQWLFKNKYSNSFFTYLPTNSAHIKPT